MFNKQVLEILPFSISYKTLERFAVKTGIKKVAHPKTGRPCYHFSIRNIHDFIDDYKLSKPDSIDPVKLEEFYKKHPIEKTFRPLLKNEMPAEKLLEQISASEVADLSILDKIKVRKDLAAIKKIETDVSIKMAKYIPIEIWRMQLEELSALFKELNENFAKSISMELSINPGKVERIVGEELERAFRVKRELFQKEMEDYLNKLNKNEATE